jgi:hypothetical protein
VLKTFLGILTVDSSNLIVHHVLYSNFKFWRRQNRLRVLRVQSLCSMHCSHVNYTLLTTDSMHLIGHHVPGFKFQRWQGCLHVEMFLCGNKLIFIHLTTNFYSTSAPKTFLCILTSDSIHPIGHYMSWFKFQILKNTWSSPCFYALARKIYS